MKKKEDSNNDNEAGQDRDEDEFDEVEEMFQWKKQLDAFMLRLKALIDPIDFAFYGPHLLRNSKSCYQRMCTFS